MSTENMNVKTLESLIETAAEKKKAEYKSLVYTNIEAMLLDPASFTVKRESVAPPISAPVVTAQPQVQSEQKPKVDDGKMLIENFYKNQPNNEGKQKGKRVFDYKRIALVASIIAVVVAALIFGGAFAQTQGPNITVSPDNSNIIQVSGAGFNASSPITLLLSENNTLAVNYGVVATTDVNGTFSTICIIPTSISGSFTLTASCGSITAQKTINVPNLNGVDGKDGVDGLSFNSTGDIMVFNGTRGAKGDTGEQGVMGNSSAGLIAVVLSIVALVIVIWPRKKY